MTVDKSVKGYLFLMHPLFIVRLLHISSRIRCKRVHLMLHADMFLKTGMNKLVEVLQRYDLMI